MARHDTKYYKRLSVSWYLIVIDYTHYTQLLRVSEFEVSVSQCLVWLKDATPRVLNHSLPHNSVFHAGTDGPEGLSVETGVLVDV